MSLTAGLEEAQEVVVAYGYIVLLGSSSAAAVQDLGLYYQQSARRRRSAAGTARATSAIAAAAIDMAGVLNQNGRYSASARSTLNAAGIENRSCASISRSTVSPTTSRTALTIAFDEAVGAAERVELQRRVSRCRELGRPFSGEGWVARVLIVAVSVGADAWSDLAPRST